ncbi:transcription factor WhiB [Segniliparus rotundus DSM 44985]|uniref:Transcriptional regulator WhiB n=1 Tax=Segniliparus rotundus (strain ATCC BAA-972 / CDC 1076 / CIP 108378 / DSM 44985 / JCM 13578) TaxID=640132 RepID=D6ZAR3_SEGRD|nr:WhiB family transcriptional regulator [Segniliparus rotundus]ADG98799.1 transcription factor WhiB [Segniliparus rotundus DSM 44985]
MPEPREALKRTVGALPLPAPPEWTEHALCAQVGGDAWFPEPGDSAPKARQICQQCPVKRECLAWAVANDERDGVWGGICFASPLNRIKARVSLGLPAQLPRKGAAA